MEQGTSLDELKEAGRSACIDLGLPISEAAFQLIDDAVNYVTEAYNYNADADPFEVGAEAGDWYSGSGIVSCYTATPVQQWADLGAWQIDVDTYVPADATIADRIGAEIAVIASTITDAVAQVAAEQVTA